MKKLLLVFTLILTASLFGFNSAQAQAPQQFNYQGVARDAGGNELVNQSIGLQLSLRSGSPTGTIVYQETQNPTTNDFGLFNIKVGNGTVVAGDMATIDWSNNSYYLQVEMDATGGTSYADMGTAQLLSVPYALYAETSGNSGVPGPTGPAGADGNDGLNGANGTTGPTGPQGPTGADGADGADGTSVTIQGSVANSGALPTTGNTNGDGYLTEDDGHLWVWNGSSWTDAGVIQGPAGADGATGPQGIAGNDGVDGATGPTGPQGPAGANGNDGAIGPQGPTGVQGIPGNDGADGVDGATGPTGPQGPAGADGADGTSVTIQGSVANSGALPTTGNTNGDGYLTEDDGHLWVWNGSSWIDAGLIQGPAGADGADGANGATGPEGPAGANGSDGATGPTGPQGPTGAAGTNGTDGADGATGPQGPTGPAGDPASDDQTLSFSNDTLYISGGNSVELPTTLGEFKSVGGIVYNTNDMNNDDFVFGSDSLGDKLGTDDNNRFFFDKSKGAFRAGGTNNTDWNDTIVGNHSVAMGYNNMASGTRSTAMGAGSNATGNTSFAVGFTPRASGDYSTAMGSQTVASGGVSTATGNDTEASGHASFSMGNATTASGDYSLASGFNTQAQGESAVALGYSTLASGHQSLALGNQTTANGNVSLAMGYQSSTVGNASTAMGIYTSSRSYAETTVGLYSALYTANSTDSYDPEDRVFAVGNGTHYNNRSNALTILKNGNTGIGTTSPNQRLHVNGSARTATAFISDTDRGSGYAGFGHVNTDPTTGYALIQSSAGLTMLNAEAGEKIQFRIGNTEHMRVDDSGFIGIGTTVPDVELHVNGQFKLVDGSQDNGKILTSSATGLASWQDIPWEDAPNDGDWTLSGNNLIGSGMGVDGALIVGSTSMDSIAGTDNDKRMFYNQALGTFRAGEAENSEWDVANQGVFSTAFGKNNVANGNYSFTAGLNSIASGITSTAMGYNTEASGNASTAMGLGVTATGQGSVALGQNSTASGEGAVALGANITASGHYSSAFGLQSSASGYAAVARGFESHADGDYAVAVGHSNQAPTIGETTIGLYATTYTPADANSNDTWYGTDRLFTIGNGTGTASRSNAVTVLKNGNVGIGSTNPYYAKFVVNGYQTRNIVGAFLNSAGTIGTNNIDRSLSAYFTHDVAAATYHAFSDARIKNIKGVSNSAADLATLASIEVTDYTMKDTISKGKQSVKKVIAQQVKEVYPQAVNNNLTDVIPNIYQLSEIESGWVNLKTKLQVGDRVKLIFSGSDQVFVVKEVTENGFKVDTDQEGKVFVYGQEVNDFHTVDYEAIAMLNVSATQELLKRIESLETEKHDLKAEVESLNDRMNRIESFIYQQVGSDD